MTIDIVTKRRPILMIASNLLTSKESARS